MRMSRRLRVTIRFYHRTGALQRNNSNSNDNGFTTESTEVTEQIYKKQRNGRMRKGSENSNNNCNGNSNGEDTAEGGGVT